MKTALKSISIFLVLTVCAAMFAVCSFALDSVPGISFSLSGSGYAVNSISNLAGENVVIPSTYNDKPVVAINKEAAKDNSVIKSVSIPATVATVGEQAFSSCSNLLSVVFAAGESEVTIRAKAFSHCISLEFVTLPKMTAVLPECFKDCASLTSVELPEGILSIGSESFMNTGVTSFAIPAGVTSIGKSAFNSCKSLESFSVATGNTAYKTVDGVLFSYDGKELVQYPLAKSGTAYYVPSGTQVIDDGAFSFSSLAVVSLPSGVVSLGDYAFSNSQALTLLYLPDGLEKIGANAFLNCNKLLIAGIPGSVTSFDNAFVGSGLMSVSFGSGLKKISSNAFKDCTSLKTVEINDGVTEIQYGAFNGCSSLESVYIPASVTAIGNSAFDGCTALTLIVDAGSYAESYAKTNSIPYQVKEEPQEEISVSIKGYMKERNEGYKTSITFHADVKAPEGYTLYWVVGDKEIKDSGSLSYKVASPTETYTVKCKLISGDRTAESESEKVVISNNFFAKIVYFFRSIFAASKLNIDQT